MWNLPRGNSAILTFFSSSCTSSIEFVFFGDTTRYLQKYLSFWSVGLKGQVGDVARRYKGCGRTADGVCPACLRFAFDTFDTQPLL